MSSFADAAATNRKLFCFVLLPVPPLVAESIMDKAATSVNSHAIAGILEEGLNIVSNVCMDWLNISLVSIMPLCRGIMKSCLDLSGACALYFVEWRLLSFD